MTSVEIDIDPHKKYLADVTERDVRHRLDKYRVTIGPLDSSPLIVCGSKPGSRLEIKPELAEWQPRLHPLDPVSLDDIKNWFGIPNETARTLMSETRLLLDGGRLWARASQVHFGNLPQMGKFDFAELGSAQKQSIKRMAYRLLYGYVDPEEVIRPDVQGVVNYMIDVARARKPQMLIASDLIVCPDQEVVFKDVPVASFNNILIYGNGQITTQSHIKIDAFKIRRVI